MVDKFPSSIQFWVLAFAAVASLYAIHCNISHPCPFDYPPFSHNHTYVHILFAAAFALLFEEIHWEQSG